MSYVDILRLVLILVALLAIWNFIAARRARRDADMWAHKFTVEYRSSNLAIKSFCNREKELIADADRLADIVRQYLADVDATAALLKDESAPQLTAERNALRHHDKIKCNLSTLVKSNAP